MCKIKGLNLKELDSRCREFVYFLNKYGFTTKYCCMGHMEETPFNKRFYIMFEDNVDDELIDKLLLIIGQCGSFNKWKRLVIEYGRPRILTNWVYEINVGTAEENQWIANASCRVFKKHFNEPYKRARFWTVV